MEASLLSSPEIHSDRSEAKYRQDHSTQSRGQADQGEEKVSLRLLLQGIQKISCPQPADESSKVGKISIPGIKSPNANKMTA